MQNEIWRFQLGCCLSQVPAKENFFAPEDWPGRRVWLCRKLHSPFPAAGADRRSVDSGCLPEVPCGHAAEDTGFARMYAAPENPTAHSGYNVAGPIDRVLHSERAVPIF